jgi:hypothetical protein
MRLGKPAIELAGRFGMDAADGNAHVSRSRFVAPSPQECSVGLVRGTFLIYWAAFGAACWCTRRWFRARARSTN